MSFETDLTEATQSLNDAATAYHGKIGDINDRVNQAEGEFAALAANLKGVVKTQMYFSGTVDPDDPAPTSQDGGTFNTVKALIDAAPSGAYVYCALVAGKTHMIDADIYCYNLSIYITKTGAGADPILDVHAHATASHNSVCAFFPNGEFGIKFSSIDIRLPTAKSDPAKPWSSARSLIRYQVGYPATCALLQTTVTGGIAGDNLGVMSSYAGSTSHLGMWTSTLDGPVFGVIDAYNGVSTISKSAATFANGAQAASTSTLGVNRLEN